MKNKCRYGSRCRYSHEGREERSIRRMPMEEKKTEPPVIQQQTSGFVPPAPRVSLDLLLSVRSHSGFRKPNVESLKCVGNRHEIDCQYRSWREAS